MTPTLTLWAVIIGAGVVTYLARLSFIALFARRDMPPLMVRALRYVPAERLLPCTNCGMVPLSREAARGKLQALGRGAALVRRELT